MLKAKFKQEKDCEQCGESFERKRGAMTDAKWEDARFCGRACYYAWQRKQGPRGSDARIEECAHPDCSRTFWAYRSQKYCRNPGCIAVRNREMERLHVERHGSPHDLWQFDQEVRDGELRRLIQAQEFDMRHGDVFMAGTKTGLSVIPLSAVARPENRAGDHLVLIETTSGVHRLTRRRRRSYVPARRRAVAA